MRRAPTSTRILRAHVRIHETAWLRDVVLPQLRADWTDGFPHHGGEHGYPRAIAVVRAELHRRTRRAAA